MRNIFRKSNTKSKIINREELLEVIDSNGLYGVEIENSSKEDTQNQLFMKSKKLEDIFKFANENDIHTIFFEYYYYNKEYFKIDLEELEDLKHIIFNDEEFQKSTNKDLRTAYIRSFLKKNSRYKELFNYGNGYDWNSYKWIDKIWKEYKEKNKQ